MLYEQNAGCIMLIKLLLFEAIKANVFAVSVYGLIQILPRTRLGNTVLEDVIYQSVRKCCGAIRSIVKIHITQSDSTG